ncbi:MAG: hypothetical protein KF688_00710 [Pirellulales bacterium]|nr:hypothetical protein [Pirellulales bacterium]
MAIWIVIGIIAAMTALMAILAPAVMAFIARLSGWRTLAERYPPADAALVERFAFQSVKIGWASYNNCVTVDVTTAGLRFEPFWLFRFQHPAFELPWDRLKATATRQMLVIPAIELSVDGGVPLLISATLAARIEAVAGEYWRAALDRAA